MSGDIVIYAVSDSIGETAEEVAKAAAVQFNSHVKEIKRIPNLTDINMVDELIDRIKSSNALIVYTVIIPEIKERLIKRTMEYNIPAVDILGPVIENMERLTGLKSKHEAGLLRKMNLEYFKRVDAIEFAVKNDDGKDPRGILKADAVLIGVSRTSKTPLSMYLAHKNIYVANLPIVPEVEPPKELYMIPREKIYGLVIQPEKLNEIRRERLRFLGLSDNASYASIDRIKEELKFSRKIMKALNCMVIDVTNKAVEETASIILEDINNRKIEGVSGENTRNY
ncbi:pyruvate, water dikinase regulatory protein [Calorimonas adulescens]|uniref:pyruvate, water dikinase regulatory protein n=1 Tax=Calorimonas adulescens TaxID=2606906 RepID=UPI00193991AF|nr:pyruvate, water dikinase regulatory protein [Calorimonas adulescens]